MDRIARPVMWQTLYAYQINTCTYNMCVYRKGFIIRAQCPKNPFFSYPTVLFDASFFMYNIIIYYILYYMFITSPRFVCDVLLIHTTYIHSYMNIQGDSLSILIKNHIFKFVVCFTSVIQAFVFQNWIIFLNLSVQLI